MRCLSATLVLIAGLATSASTVNRATAAPATPTPTHAKRAVNRTVSHSAPEPFDVLQDGAFLMIRRHVSQHDARQVVMLERWDAGLTSGNRTQ